ncbi:hypothetical protein [Gemmatimonas sp.]
MMIDDDNVFNVGANGLSHTVWCLTPCQGRTSPTDYRVALSVVAQH